MGTERQFARIVAIGDLNGAVAVLREILRGVGVADDRDRWSGGRTHLIQVGDIFDRGGGACASLELLRKLQAEAPRDGGRVTVLLGNHEVMAVLGHGNWDTAEECLFFASEDERQTWPERIARAKQEIAEEHPSDTPEMLLDLQLRAWKREHVPGRAALSEALRPDGSIGQILRTLPVAELSDGFLFCHGGLVPQWARLGLDGLEAATREAWAYIAHPKTNSIFHADSGPLWNRELAMEETARARERLDHALDLLGADRMVVGHTPTCYVPGGMSGEIALAHDGRLICIDVGLGSGLTSAALVIEGGEGREWTPEKTRLLWSRDSE